MNVTSLQSLIGVWMRKSIRWPDGREDTTTRVWWLQADPWFADLRIPANRPDFGGVASWEQCNAAQQSWLRTQEGFAGVLTPEGDAWLWKREMDIQPTVSGRRDIGRLRFEDSDRRIMVEEGVDEPYVEVWERIDEGGDVWATKLENPDGLIVAVGDHFLLVLDREPMIEISHGTRSDWRIMDSSLPWREGQNITAPPLGLRH